MAEIRRFPLWRHLRADASSHILFWRRGKLVADGRGLAFWFQPMSASVAEVPVDQREQAFVFHGRSADFQDVTAQGAVQYRIDNAAAIAERIDFTIDLSTGGYRRDPLEKVAALLAQLAHRGAWDYIAANPLRVVLAEGPAEIRRRVEAALVADRQLSEMGITVVAVAVLAVDPVPDVERALEAPAREKIQQEADEAAFGRRAMAVEKERAIQENELQNRIELAKRNELLIAQEGMNASRQATDQAEAARIAAEAEAGRRRVQGEAQADSIRAVEGARVATEKDRIGAYAALPPNVMMALAARELAGKLEKINIDHLSVTPDLLASMLTDLVGATTKKVAG